MCPDRVSAFCHRACRHGDRCSRIHNKPTISQTLLLQNMYQNPMMSMAPGADGLPPQMDPRASQEHFEVCELLVAAPMSASCRLCHRRVCVHVACSADVRRAAGSPPVRAF
jgi:hypothetical protein